MPGSEPAGLFSVCVSFGVQIIVAIEILLSSAQYYSIRLRRISLAASNHTMKRTSIKGGILRNLLLHHPDGAI